MWYNDKESTHFSKRMKTKLNYDETKFASFAHNSIINKNFQLVITHLSIYQRFYLWKAPHLKTPKNIKFVEKKICPIIRQWCFISRNKKFLVSSLNHFTVVSYEIKVLANIKKKKTYNISRHSNYKWKLRGKMLFKTA